MRLVNKYVVCIIAAVVFVGSASAAPGVRNLVASGWGGAVVTGHPLASRAALAVLAEGGSAADAAVAAGFVLAVVDFGNSGLGGDGHALVRAPGV